LLNIFCRFLLLPAQYRDKDSTQISGVAVGVEVTDTVSISSTISPDGAFAAVVTLFSSRFLPMIVAGQVFA